MADAYRRHGKVERHDSTPEVWVHDAAVHVARHCAVRRSIDAVSEIQQQPFGGLEIVGIEAFCKARINTGKQGASFVLATLA